MTKKATTKKTATNFRLDKDTIKKLDWLKERYHIGTRTAALIIAIGNEATRLEAPHEVRQADWFLKNQKKK